ncbi:protein NATD1 [Triplophysa dalaica]|uniref:protein NATD1 n=1 Tax=Triplophysa dalaica TaxID=1582913 RepID=UPI0024DFEBEA|nr:protein NATD1 [Triplophysa dalaica]XP_056609324.1 protein NATD1 [Triplophysa dalaica]
MARYIQSQKCLFRFIRGYNSSQRFTKNNFCAFTNDSIPHVIHDRQNQRFTIACDADEKSVLKYISRGDGQVELISTEVPESHRGKGVAAHLAKAALDFVIEEDLKARISCWYIRKYVDENPHLGYRAYIKD